MINFISYFYNERVYAYIFTKGSNKQNLNNTDFNVKIHEWYQKFKKFLSRFFFQNATIIMNTRSFIY